MSDLFSNAAERTAVGTAPLPERLRPRTLDEVVGQDNLLGRGQLLRRQIEAKRIPSMILWGPPGTGKTTIARLLAHHTQARFVTMSAVLSGVADLRRLLKEAEEERNLHRTNTLLFVDEIHRWSKNQQDALLHSVERGVVTLIGATTENPSFELNAALLSRARVFVLEPLGPQALRRLVERALKDRLRGLGTLELEWDDEVLDHLTASAHGDARQVLSTLELAAYDAQVVAGPNASPRLTVQGVQQAAQHRTLLYDRASDQHYGVISAFIKSMRGSDPDAAVYYLARMLEAGEDPRFLCRRMVIFASEDIGQADPRALSVSVDAHRAFELVGLPEGALPLTQAAIYLSLAPKSNSVLSTYSAARRVIRETGPLAVPSRLLNPTNGLQRALGHGEDSSNPRETGEFASDGESHLPEPLTGLRLYHPSSSGEEPSLAQRYPAPGDESELSPVPNRGIDIDKKTEASDPAEPSNLVSEKPPVDDRDLKTSR